MFNSRELDRELTKRAPNQENVPDGKTSLKDVKKDFDTLANLARSGDMDIPALLSMRDVIYSFLVESGLNGEDEKFLEWSNSLVHYVGTEQYKSASQLLEAFGKARGSENLEKVFRRGIEEIAEARGQKTSTRTKGSFLGR